MHTRLTHSQRIVRASLFAVLGPLLLTGCSLQYNGAWKTKDAKWSETAVASQKPVTDDKTTPSAMSDPESGTRSPQYSTTPVPAGTNAVLIPGDAPASNVAADQAQMRLATQTASPSLSPLGLFGQLPQSQTGSVGSADNLRQISFATEGADFDPALDATGAWMVFASTRHRQTSDIYLQKVGGTAVTQLTNDPANDMMPVFSPDGKRIAFASDRAGNWDIYLMDVAGGQAVQLTNDPTQELHASFSPDGRQLVFCSYGAKSGQWEMVVIDVDNPANKRFIGPGLFPSWSPVDNRIVFQRARERGTRWFGVWTIEIVEGQAMRPTALAVSSNAAAINPQWSPDGRHIVFSTVIDPEQPIAGSAPSGGATARPGIADLWVISADGSNRTNLTNGQFVNVQPAWSRDGQVYFVSNRGKDGVENIWSVDPAAAIQITSPTSATAHRGRLGQPTAPLRETADGNDAGPMNTSASVPTP